MRKIQQQKLFKYVAEKLLPYLTEYFEKKKIISSHKMVLQLTVSTCLSSGIRKTSESFWQVNVATLKFWYQSYRLFYLVYF